MGMVEGRAKMTAFLFFPLNGDAGYRAAIDDALKKSDADGLINCVVDKRVYHGVFVSSVTTIVRGLAIKRK
jgi:hypothetical protein